MSWKHKDPSEWDDDDCDLYWAEVEEGKTWHDGYKPRESGFDEWQERNACKWLR